MSYLPTVVWQTVVNNVAVVNSTTYTLSIANINPNDPGASSDTVAVGYYIRDWVGHTYSITGINVGGDPLRIQVVDDFLVGIGPQQGRLAYVYKSVGGGMAPYVAPIRYERLDKSAIGYGLPIDLDVLWKHRGLKLTSGIDEYINVTKVTTGLNIALSDYDPNGGWNGGGSIVINSAGGGAVSEYLLRPITQVAHGFVKDFIYHNGTIWVKAKSDNINTGATHYAVRLTDDTFNLIPVGEVDTTGMLDDLENPLVAGDYYFLSQTIAGRVSGTKYTSGITQAVLKANELNQSSISIQEPYNITAGSDLVLSDGILHWDEVNSKYDPYTSQTAGAFDSGIAAPFHTNRLNYDGYLYGTKLFSNNTEVSVLGHIHPEFDITFTDITAGDVSTAKHGFAPKLPNDATKFFDGVGGWTVPVGRELIVNKTHAELYSMMNSSTLSKGQLYRITDFATKHMIMETSEINTGSLEPLIVLAIDANKIHFTAKSEVYPNDEISYLITDVLCEDSVTPRKGRITYRKDTINNLSAYEDWRSVKYRRWNITAALYDSGEAYNNELTKYLTDDSYYLYVSLGYNNASPASPGSNWMLLFKADGNFLSASPYSNTYQDLFYGNSVIINNLVANVDYKDFYIFGNSDGTDIALNRYKDISIGEGSYNNVFLKINLETMA